MSSPKDFKVAVVGGGMCGLTCAIALAKGGVQVQIFESAPQFGEVGAGVGLGSNALKALDGLGVLDAVLAWPDHRPAMRSFRFIAGEGEHEHIHDYPSSPDDLGLGVYRPTFLGSLMPLVDKNIVHFDKRCVDITTVNGRKVLHFADGTTHTTDLVIGADGIKSVVRQFVAGDTHLRFTGTVAYRGLIPTDDLRRAGVRTEMSIKPLCWMGIDKHFITFPIQQGKVINVVAFTTDRQVTGEALTGPWVETVLHEELLNAYSDWGRDARIVLEHIRQPSKWSIHAVNPPLSSFVKDNIVLVGDAAHGMPPHLGAGVGQGFEDVFALCKLLTDPGTHLSNVKRILSVYDSIRPVRANMVLYRSAQMGNIYEEHGKGHDNAAETTRRLTGMWEPVWHHDLEAEVIAAIRRFAHDEKRKGHSKL